MGRRPEARHADDLGKVDVPVEVPECPLVVSIDHEQVAIVVLGHGQVLPAPAAIVAQRRVGCGRRSRSAGAGRSRTRPDSRR